ncbi:MAG: class I SAM-dependent methyltransferase [Alphaproteobacteria bacterium]|nr:class I SAM-dependent methyltransferase [Alphaproteobacteria bacterium]
MVGRTTADKVGGGHRDGADRLGMALQLAGNVARMAWYSGINLMLQRRSRRMSKPAEFTPTRPVPNREELLSDARALLRADAEAVAAGLYPPGDEEASSPIEHLRRLRAMFQDLPELVSRRQERDASSVRDAAGDVTGHHEALPDYFTQDFHFQTGGYLTDGSARLYDVQVETLFYGAAAAMRRAGLRPIAEFMHGRDQRRVSLIDVACGTGRFLSDVRRAFPAMRLTGCDLSQAYLEEARRHMGRLRPARLVFANAEALPFEDASQDIVTCIFLFHELPPEVRRVVTREIARMLKPGGLFVFIDSLQMGDKPNWDGLLEAFPVRFHEPYYRSFVIDDLETMFAAEGLQSAGEMLAFLSKVVVRRKAEAAG